MDVSIEIKIKRSPEIEKILTKEKLQKRARSEIEKEKDAIVIKIHAADISAAHAAASSYLRTLKIIESIKEMKEVRK